MKKSVLGVVPGNGRLGRLGRLAGVHRNVRVQGTVGPRQCLPQTLARSGGGGSAARWDHRALW